jgi:catalase
MRVDGNYGSTPAYTPNSYGLWSAQPGIMEPPLDLEGAMYRYDPKDDPTDDCFRAGGDLWRILAEDKKQILIENTVTDIASVTVNIKYRHATHCYLADPEYGERFTMAAGLNFDKVKELAKLSHTERVQATLSPDM